MSVTRIVFTGGGSAGHVSANLILIPHCLASGYEVHYIGSAQGIERKLLASYPDVIYHPISTGKWRRYASWRNVTDIFRVTGGILQAWRLIRRLKPKLIFSKGGFVSVPAVLGAWMNGVPSICLEPDLHIGLANRISLAFARTLYTTYPETERHHRSDKLEYIGPIVKEELMRGDAERGRIACGFTTDKPVLLIVGGSQGSQAINAMVKCTLHILLKTFQVIHIMGSGSVKSTFTCTEYKVYDYVSDLYPDLLALADIVVSRAGSNSIHELLSLRKPMLLLPHMAGGTRNGQVKNAQNFVDRGLADILLQEELTEERWIGAILKLYEERDAYIGRMSQVNHQYPTDKMMNIILTYAER